MIDKYMSHAIKRVIRDFIDVGKKFTTHCENKENLLEQKVIIIGPSDTPYENGKFELLFVFPTDYPFKPPKVKFLTKIYHSNVNNEGGICHTILRDTWSPAITTIKIISEILDLMKNPYPDDNPLVPEIANLYITDKYKFNETAKEWTLKYAG
jgi:ubiquitin-conjugating enzyme E2 D